MKWNSNKNVEDQLNINLKISRITRFTFPLRWNSGCNWRVPKKVQRWPVQAEEISPTLVSSYKNVIAWGHDEQPDAVCKHAIQSQHVFPGSRTPEGGLLTIWPVVATSPWSPALTPRMLLLAGSYAPIAQRFIYCLFLQGRCTIKSNYRSVSWQLIYICCPQVDAQKHPSKMRKYRGQIKTQPHTSSGSWVMIERDYFYMSLFFFFFF